MPNNPVPANGEAVPRIIPIPHCNQNAADDLHIARSFLRVIDAELERASGDDCGMSRRVAADMLHVIGQVSNMLTTIQRLLDDDRIPSHLEVYQSVRMEEVLENWERAR